MKTIIRVLCALIVVLVFNVSAQTFWVEGVGGNCPPSILCVEKTPEMVTIRANLGAGQSVVEILVDMPWGYDMIGGSGDFGFPIIGMGNFESPLSGVRFPAKVVFWGGEEFNETDSISFGAGGGSVIPLGGFFSDLILPPTDPDPSPWLLMALVRDSTGQEGWVGATMVPIPEPKWSSVAVYITFGVLVLSVLLLRRHHT